MDLSHPINTLATAATGRVLEVLAGTSVPLSGGEIARLAAGDVSRAGVSKALGRLEMQGLVTADRRRSATFYALNRQHLAYPAIEQLVGLRKALRTAIAEAIEGWEIQPVHSSIFGSAARADATRTSDVDLLFVKVEPTSPADESRWQEQLDDLRAKIRAISGNRAQTIVVTPTRLREHVRAQDSIVGEWMRDGIRLTGEPLPEVIDEFA